MGVEVEGYEVDTPSSLSSSSCIRPFSLLSITLLGPIGDVVESRNSDQVVASGSHDGSVCLSNYTTYVLCAV